MLGIFLKILYALGTLMEIEGWRGASFAIEKRSCSADFVYFPQFFVAKLLTAPFAIADVDTDALSCRLGKTYGG